MDLSTAVTLLTTSPYFTASQLQYVLLLVVLLSLALLFAAPLLVILHYCAIL